MSMLRTLAIAAALLAATACSLPKDWFTSHTGNMPAAEKIAQLKNGQSKENVTALLGDPSSVVALDRDTWIYMSSDIEQFAFFKPKEISRDVLVLKFSKTDKLEDIKRMTEANGETVTVDQGKTEAAGHNPGFFKRFFGATPQYNPVASAAQ